MANNSLGPPPPTSGTPRNPVNVAMTGPNAQGVIGHTPPSAGYGPRPATINGVATSKLGVGSGGPK